MINDSKDYITIKGGEELVKYYYIAKKVICMLDISIRYKFLNTIISVATGSPTNSPPNSSLKDYFPHKSELELRKIRSLLEKDILKINENFIIIDGNLCPR